MNKKSKRTLTPRLRFPEFWDKGEWEAQPLDSVSQFVKKKIPLHQLSLDTYVSTENLSRDYGGIEQASKLPQNGSATEYKPDDILIANIRPYLKKVWRSNRSGGASNDVIVIRPKAALYKDYLPMVIANDAFINYVMTTAKGVKMPRGDIASIKDYVVHYPTLPEQQKIADCLGSLDGLIAAEGRKLKALKTHKKGLMQQLFPGTPTSSSAGGESAGGDAGAPSQPRLRFPEFRDKGEWEEKVLSDACLMQAGKFVAASDIREQDEDGLYPCYGGNGLRGFTKSRTHDGIHPLIGRQGALCGNVRLARGEFHATEHAVVATPRKGVHVIWLFYMLDRLNLNRYATGQAQPGLSVDVLEKVALALPALEQEQRRIASCLTALDTQITAQAAKIETLKQHKRGLMQQLFPAPEESEA